MLHFIHTHFIPQINIELTSDFIHYLETMPMVFEVFGNLRTNGDVGATPQPEAAKGGKKSRENSVEAGAPLDSPENLVQQANIPRRFIPGGSNAVSHQLESKTCGPIEHSW